ncbi:MAG TPA: aerial mycelium formation protein [Acidimicrobiia bacterium]|nr:aerial mycelium formation protein [Acidimicrobiia bacterium]
MDQQRRRIDRILDPAYVADLGARSVDDLRTMRDECVNVETEVSYVRRLAQARLDIIAAEMERRSSGGSLGSLIDALPRILADGGQRGQRGAPANSHMPQQLAPAMDIEWTRGLEPLVTDATLANLPALSDDELRETTERLRTLESDVSATRRSLHRVMDAIEHELATRLRVGPS